MTINEQPPPFEILIGKTGDRASAETFPAALYTAARLVDDYADAIGTQGARKAARDSITITENGAYAGLATAMAREGCHA